MFWILLAMLGIVSVAVLVVVYVAYPHRGQAVPNAPWMGDAMRKAVDLMPTLPDDEAPRSAARQDRERQHH